MGHLNPNPKEKNVNITKSLIHNYYVDKDGAIQRHQKNQKAIKYLSIVWRSFSSHIAAPSVGRTGNQRISIDGGK